MQVNDAIDRISEIHDHLSRSEIYRGYRAIPVAISGVVAIFGAAAQPFVVGDQIDYVVYWCALALGCVVLAGSGIVRKYLRDGTRARRQAQKVIGQFLPCLVAGMLVTLVVAIASEGWVVLLPGLWSVIFGLGIFASRPYLPRVVGGVALYYVAGGGLLLVLAESHRSLSPWTMGWTFGVGQIAAAVVLYWKIEREDS